MHSFYTMPEYEAWREGLTTTTGWDIKYYKVWGALAFELVQSSASCMLVACIYTHMSQAAWLMQHPPAHTGSGYLLCG